MELPEILFLQPKELMKQFFVAVLSITTFSCSFLSSQSIKDAIMGGIVHKVEKQVKETVDAEKDKWWAKRLNAFAGYPKVPPFIENPQYATELHWWLPHEKLTNNVDEKVALAALGGTEFSLRRATIMAITAASTFLSLTYRNVHLLNNRSSIIHFSPLILYDLLVIAFTQGLAFNLENALTVTHQKLIQKYPFFRTSQGSSLFKSIASLVKYTLPIATFYTHFKFPFIKKEIKV